MSVWKSRTAAVAVGATIAVGLGASGSVAADLITSKDIKNETIRSKDVKDGTLKGKDVKDGALTGADLTDGSIGLADLAPAARSGAAPGIGINGTEVATLADDVVIAKIGGPINDNNTDLHTALTLPAGQYLVTVDGAVESSADAVAPMIDVFPQLSLWLDKNGDGEFRWQDGEGDISPNTLMPAVKNRHRSISGTTVITLTATTKVGLLAFGYASDQSAARSGDQPDAIKVTSATLTATPLS
ncbi:hypothetical protein FHP29_01705 [Nocardioides albidus]|uniref:Uncharacterized protein n=1 Tax=Nocardioides albidus TaxID=1517589 RepID=A0A5C4WJR6_9ACTN|nr:hypothetical protein [Nocardioides albidus]TNM48252.1 hypothetical protein FHP29_01705 [Nocardioides albidus]